MKRRPPVTFSLVPGSVASHTEASGSASGHYPVVLDVGGRRVDLDPGEAVRLRDAAAARAGRSSAARDLSLVLDRALHRGQILALRRSEVHTLAHLAGQLGLFALARGITTPAA